MTFKNLDTLMKYIQDDIQDVLRNEVAETVKSHMQEAIQTDVYDAYDPKYYTRRLENGGLIDGNNIETAVSGNTLTVRDKAPLDNGRTDYALDDIIIHSYGNQPFPRDFISSTEERLIKTNDHVEAMKNGLRKKGYNVK